MLRISSTRDSPAAFASCRLRSLSVSTDAASGMVVACVKKTRVWELNYRAYAACALGSGSQFTRFLLYIGHGGTQSRLAQAHNDRESNAKSENEQRESEILPSIAHN